MNLIIDPDNSSLQNNSQEIDELLKKSKIEALGDIKFLSEIDRINTFIKNHKKNSIDAIDSPTNEKGDQIPNIDSYFESLPTIKKRISIYSQYLNGIPHQILNLIKLVHTDAHVLDSSGLVLTLKTGDLLIRYCSGIGAFGYVHKSHIESNRYNEKYISGNAQVNYLRFDDEYKKSNSNWLIICDNFLSASAIFEATGVTTIAIPISNNAVVLKQIIQLYPEKKRLYFVDANCGEIKQIEGITYIYPLSRTEKSWAECRDNLSSHIDQMKVNDQFKQKLRDVMVYAIK